jgi:hypothetical protein
MGDTSLCRPREKDTFLCDLRVSFSAVKSFVLEQTEKLVTAKFAKNAREGRKEELSSPGMHWLQITVRALQRITCFC